jgi:SAM-dependent methyltransferase
VKCRHCRAPVDHLFLDLGFAPPSNAYRTAVQLAAPEVTFPLKLHVCDRCWLVQTEDYPRADELFDSDYAYFSSVSQTWAAHAANYFEMARTRFALNGRSLVLEIACNDGYLLRYFVRAGIPCLGIEPTASTAAAAEGLGIPVRREFFKASLAARLAQEGLTADLIVGNNVYAHVPDVNDFTAGLKAALKPGGTITLEFPHLMRMIEEAQFDTAYHEHFSYLSLYTVARMFSAAGLRVFDVEELSTHGGSLRVFGCHADDIRQESPAVSRGRGDGRSARAANAGDLSKLSSARRSDQGRSAGFLDRAEAFRPERRRIWRGRERQYAPQLRRRQAGFAALRL